MMHLSTIHGLSSSLLGFTLANAFAIHGLHNAERQGVSTVPATDAVSPQVKANVSATIDRWLSDIEAVNNFVDNVRDCESPEEISSQAATAFVAAQNEGASNAILQQEVSLDSSGSAAAQALLAQFNIIGPAINDTIFNPGHLDQNLDAINGARCPPPRGAGAISEEGAVQQAAASAVGITVPPPATPAACNAAAAAPTK